MPLPKISDEVYYEIIKLVREKPDFATEMLDRMLEENPIVEAMVKGMFDATERVLTEAGVDTDTRDFAHHSATTTLCAVYAMLVVQSYLDANKE